MQLHLFLAARAVLFAFSFTAVSALFLPAATRSSPSNTEDASPAQHSGDEEA